MEHADEDSQTIPTTAEGIFDYLMVNTEVILTCHVQDIPAIKSGLSNYKHRFYKQMEEAGMPTDPTNLRYLPTITITPDTDPMTICRLHVILDQAKKQRGLPVLSIEQPDPTL